MATWSVSLMPGGRDFGFVNWRRRKPKKVASDDALLSSLLDMMAGVLELDAETLAVVKVMLAHLGIGQSICPSLGRIPPSLFIHT
jgi:hypothetical protein